MIRSVSTRWYPRRIFFTTRLHVVVAQSLEYTAKIGERMFVGFEQRLLRGVRISPMEGVARAHAAHREELQLHNFAAQLGHALEPVHLCFLAHS